MAVNTAGRLTLAALLLAVLYILAWPLPIEPVAWEPTPAPALEGPYAINDKLSAVERLEVGGRGPEHVTVTDTGRIYTGLEDGRIMRLEADGTRLKKIVDTGGRPQTVEVAADGTLIVADTYRGLLSVDSKGRITELLTEVDGVPMMFANDIAISSTGTIYLTDSSDKFRQHELVFDFVEHGGRGRLIEYIPSSGSARVLLDGLQFVNGVALAPDESSLLVNECAAYRTIRYWLKGERAGESEIFIDNLPGFPDNIRCYERGICWIAFTNPRIEALDLLAPHPFMRKVLMRLPEWARPRQSDYAFVIGVDLAGNVVENLQDPSPDGFGQITGASEHNGVLYLGNLNKTAIGLYRLAGAAK